MAPEYKMAPKHSRFLLVPRIKARRLLRGSVAALQSTTSHHSDGPRRRTRVNRNCKQVSAPKPEKQSCVFFGSWHILYRFNQHICGIWIFGSCGPFKWKNEISAQEDNVNKVQFWQLSYATALSIFIPFPVHQFGKLFKRRCFVIVVRK